MPIQELPPEWHVPKALTNHARGGQVRVRKQAAIRGEIVQPRCPDDLERFAQRALHVREEGRQVSQSVAEVVDPQ